MNTKLKCLLLDDELPGLTLLKILCEEIDELEVVKAFNNPQTFLSEAKELDFDLCIMDIEMPGMSGIQVANALPDKSVIFTTAYKEFGADAFELNAVDYLLKPIKKERLRQAVKKAVDRFVSKKTTEFATVQVLTDKGKVLLPLGHVLYFKSSEVDSRDKTAFMSDGTEMTLKNLNFEKLLDILKDQPFRRINRQEVVGKHAVQSFTNEYAVVLSANKTSKLYLLITNAYRATFLEMMNA